jgi:curved DNA-binding protein CbpA
LKKKNLFKDLSKNYGNNQQYKDVDITKDYYKVLGIDKDTKENQIKIAYFKLAKKHHPDLNGGKSSEKFKEITAAYEILSDNNKKSYYDNNQGASNFFGGNRSNNTGYGQGFGGFTNGFQGQKGHDSNYHNSFYKSNNTGQTNYNQTKSGPNDGNFYSNFKQNADNFKQDFYHTYTHKDSKTGKNTTYTYKANGKDKYDTGGNPFYNDFDDLLKKRRMEREAKNGKHSTYNDYNNDQNRKARDFYNQQQNFHFDNGNPHYNKVSRQEFNRLVSIVLFSGLFIILYSNHMKRRRQYYETHQNQIQPGFRGYDKRNYYEPIPTAYQNPEHHSHKINMDLYNTNNNKTINSANSYSSKYDKYENNYGSGTAGLMGGKSNNVDYSTSYRLNDVRTQNKDDVPPYK